MNFMANSGIWGTMFGVPCIVADNFLKLATGAQLKVLLYLLRCSGRECTDEEIAVNTGITPQEASEAVMFWQQVNVLSQNQAAPVQSDNSLMTAPSAIHEANMTPPQQQQTAPTAVAANSSSANVAHPRRANLTPSEISAVMKESSEISELFKTAESFLGSLNHTQQNSLIWIYNYLGLKTEVIITLLSYCVSIEKTNSGYIEKIACSWSENEINSLESAQEEVARLLKTRDFTSRIMKAFEMKRKPTTKQSEFIAQWQKTGFSIELIHYAYEKTIEKIDKLSFEYINKILLSWKDSGFVTVQNVKDAETSYRKNKNNGSKSDNDDFDVDKYKIFINNF